MKHKLLNLAALAVLSVGVTASHASLVWQQVPIPGLAPGTDLTRVWARNPHEVYVWGQVGTNPTPNAVLYRWDGTSTNWATALTITGQWPSSVFGVGGTDVFAATTTNVWRSADNGLTWVQQSLPALPVGYSYGKLSGTANNMQLQAGWSDASSYAYGAILRFDGMSWQVVYVWTTATFQHGAPSTLSVFAPNEGYFVGCWGWGKWDGGAWSFHGIQFDFCDVYDTWAMRDGGGNLHWWAVGNNNFSNGIRVWCFDPATQSFTCKYCYCFGDGDDYNIGGALGIWGSGTNDVYVIGALASTSSGQRSGRVYHFDGNNWSRLTDVGTIYPLGIWGTSSNDVWIAGLNGSLLHAQQTELSDGFEAAALDPFWSVSAQSGYVLFPGTNQAHGGSQSVELVTTNSSLNKSVSLYHQFPAATYGTASVWVYDTGADVSSANYITLSVSSGGAQVAGLGTWDYDLGPGDGGSTYTYGVGGSSAYTGIDRTRAWHQFTICCWASTLTLMIDGNVIYSGQGGRTFDRVGLYLGGPNWRPACSVQFDDFQFVSQPLQPSADIHMYAGVTVAGTVGAPYQIQYKANIKSTNWLGLTDLVLPASPYLFIDTTSPAAPQRLYRVLAQP